MRHRPFFSLAPAALAFTLASVSQVQAASAHSRPPHGVAVGSVDVHAIRLWAGPDNTRVVLDLSGSSLHTLSYMKNPDRVVLDVPGGRLTGNARSVPTPAGAVRRVRMAKRATGELRFVFDVAHAIRAKSFLARPNDRYGYRLVLDLPGGVSASSGERSGVEAPGVGTPGAGAAGATAPGAAVLGVGAPVKAEHARAQARDLIIAIDAGHGGEDPGAIGKNGTREKDVVLAIARELARQMNAEPGMRAVLTRDGDYFVPLRDRMRRARAQQADLFVSIHADSIRDRSVDGSSVYILSQRGATDEASRWLAERENASDLIGGVSLDDKSDVLASVLLDLSQSASLTASQVAADYVLHHLNEAGEVRKPQVQQARFMVLKSPDIPSMLVETAYISNPREEQRLRGAVQQAKLAGAIHRGVRAFFYSDPPVGTRIAQLAGRAAPSSSQALTTAEDSGG